MRGFADGRVFTHGDGVFFHELLERHRVVERGVHGPLIGVECVAEADAEHVGVADDADELLPADDGDVMHAVLADELADFGDRLAMMNGDEVGAHDFGDWFVAFHIGGYS